MLLPLFDRKPELRLRKRPVAMTLGVIYFGGFLILWMAGRQLTSVDPGVDLRPGDPREQVAPIRAPEPTEAESADAEPAENGEEEANR